MLPCPSCGTHLRLRDRACFACGAAALSLPRGSAAALLLGLSVACAPDTTAKTDSGLTETDQTDHTGYTAQPTYGVTPTDHTGSIGETAYTSGVDYGVSMTHSATWPDHSGGDHSGGSGAR